MAKKEKKIIDKKDSKIVKISLSDILKKGMVKLEPRDMTKYAEDDKKKVEEDKIRYEKDLETEKNRFENLTCPSCKSRKKAQQTITHRDGPLIIGGNSVSVLADYCICQNCGTMFVDLNKKKVAPPYQGMFSHRTFY